MKQTVLLLLMSFLTCFFVPDTLAVSETTMTITTHERPPTKPEDVKVRYYDKGQYMKCEEIGFMYIVHHGGGFIKKVQKEAASVGGTDLYMGERPIVFVCPN